MTTRKPSHTIAQSKLNLTQGSTLVYRLLEPRIVFDGAVAETIEAVAVAPPPGPQVVSSMTSNGGAGLQPADLEYCFLPPDTTASDPAGPPANGPVELMICPIDPSDLAENVSASMVAGTHPGMTAVPLPATGTPQSALAITCELIPAIPVETSAAAPWAAADAPTTEDAAVTGPGAEPPTTGATIVFIDASVGNPAAFAAAAGPDAQIVLLMPGGNALEQIAGFLANYESVAAIHIVSHGASGQLQLGGTTIDAAVLEANAQHLATIGAAMSADGDILLYGCSIAEGSNGAAFLSALAELTGADVAASTDDTGAASMGGNWALEHATGAIEATPIAASSWEGVLAPLVISVSTLPTVTGGTGVGATAVWTNAGTIGGTPIDIVATVVSVTPGATVNFSTFFGTYSNGIPADDLWVIVNGGTVTIQWQIFASGTNQTVVAFGNPNFQIADIDGNGSIVTPFPGIEVEAVAPSLNGLTSYTLNNPTNLLAGVSGGNLLVVGTVNQNSEPSSLVAFNWTNVSNWQVTYTAQPGWGDRFFFHDGDGDMTFTSANTTFMLGLDLDGNNSTAPGTGYHGSYIENGAGVPIVDADVTITQHSALGSTLGSATITLTNAQAGDALMVDALPPGITASIDTSVPGKITVTLSGAASLASYQAALQAITFANSSENPATVNRLIEITVTNTTFGTTSNVALATIAVTAVNDPPVDGDEAVSTSEDTPVTGNLLANASDPEGHALTISAFSIAGQSGPFTVGSPAVIAGVGTLTIQANGAYSFVPAANYHGPVPVVTYTVSDGHGGTDTSTLTISVSPVADPPVAADDSFTVNEDGSVTIPVLGNDSDVDGDPLTVTHVDGQAISEGQTVSVANGTVTLTGGQLVFTPAANYHGPASFTYTITDGTASALATVSGTVSPVNDAPVASDDTFSVSEDGSVTIPVLGNDSDIDGDPLTITHVDGQPISEGQTVSVANGTVTLTGGQLVFTPAANYHGPASFTYTITDGTASAVATVSGTVSPVNDAPVASDDTFTVSEDGSVTIPVLGNDSDVDGDPLTVTHVDGQAISEGQTVSVANGTVTLTGGQLVFAPAANYHGPASFTYTITDGTASAVATVSGTVSPVNDAPVASDDTFTVNEDGSVTIPVLGNDSDVDGDPLTVTHVDGQPISEGQSVAVANGTITLAGGQLVFTPAANYHGPASFTYTITDGSASAVATVSGTVSPVNDAPVASDDTFTVSEDGSVTIPVLGNDSDVDGDPLTVTHVDGQAISEGQTVSVANGTVTLTGGQLVFAPAANYHGPASFTYTITDGTASAVATVSGTVSPVNDAPVASDDTFSVNEDGSVTIPVLGNDSDVDGDPLTVTHVDGQPISEGQTVPVANGTVTLTGGQLVFAPAANYHGPASFTYTITDGTASAVATVSGTVSPVNDAPVASDDTFTVNEDGSVTIPVLGNDSDVDGDPLTVTHVDGQPISEGQSVAVANGTVTLAGGQLVFTPAANYHGPASFTYTITDGTASAVATVSGTVSPVNDAPVAVDDGFTVDEDGSVTLPVLGNDSDVDGDPLSVTHVDGQPISEGQSVAVANGTITLAGGQLVFTPAANYHGPASFTYTITDGTASAVATVSGTVSPVNDGPVASDDTFTVDEDGSVTIPVLGNDSDVDGDPLTVTHVDGQPISEGQSVAVANGTITLAGGQLVFTPAANYHGPASFTYTITDGSASAVATVSGTVSPVNDAPVAVDDGFTVDEDGSVTIPVLGNDSDVDGDPLTVTHVDGQPISEGQTVAVANGTVTLTGGQLVFAPAANYHGPASFTYTISDGTASAVATVSGTVSPVNDAPVASDDTFTVNEDGSVTIPVLGNDSDVDGDPLTVTHVDGQPISEGQTVPVANGTVTLTGGQLVFAPAANYHGPASFTYTITDGTASAVATVSGTVSPVNDAPVASDDTFTVSEDGIVTIPVLGNDSDVDGDPLTVTHVDGQAISEGQTVSVANGTVTLTGGQLVFAPAPNYHGPASFTYTISDGTASAVASVSGTVSPVNDAPVASDDTFTVNEDGSVTIPVLGNDSDVDGDPLTVTHVDGQPISEGQTVPVANGTVTLTGGQLVFAPAANYHGPASFTYTITDGTASAVATVSGTVSPVNDAPVASDDTFSVNEDGSVTISVLGNDSDVDGDPLTVTHVDGQPISEGQTVSVANGTVTLSGGQLVFAPASNYHGPASFTYTISDGTASAVATVSGTVSPVNDAPVASDDTFTVNEDGSVTIPVLGNDSDVDGDPLTVTHVDGQPISEGQTVSVANGTVTLTGGQLVFAPAANYHGPASFTYTITDGTASAVATVSGTVSPVNDAPVASDDTFTVSEDGSVTIPVLGNDSDVDGDPLTVTHVDGQPISEGQTVAVVNGTVTLTGGQLVFAPAADYHGPASFTYTVSDGTTSATATITGAVSPINDAPVAGIALPQFSADAATVSVDMGSAFSDIDGEPLSFTATGLPPGLSIDPVTGVISGTIDPAASSGGPYFVTITATDPSGAAAQVMCMWQVTNPPPVAADDIAVTDAGRPITIHALANDHDPDDAEVSIVHAHSGNGTVVIQPDGTLHFTPAPGFAGTAVITYTISDGNGGYATATVLVEVRPSVHVPNDTAQPTLAGPAEAGSRPEVHGEGAVLQAVNGGGGLQIGGLEVGGGWPGGWAMQGLGGIAALDGPGAVLDSASASTHAWHPLGAGGISGDDALASDMTLKGLTGFSLKFGHLDAAGASQIVMVETLSRDRLLIIEVREADVLAEPELASIRVLSRDGSSAPAWLDVLASGLLTGRWPADVDHVDLRIVVELADGSRIEQDVRIDAAAGEVQPLGKERHGGLPRIFAEQFDLGEPLPAHSIEALGHALAE